MARIGIAAVVGALSASSTIACPGPKQPAPMSGFEVEALVDLAHSEFGACASGRTTEVIRVDLSFGLDGHPSDVRVSPEVPPEGPCVREAARRLHIPPGSRNTWTFEIAFAPIQGKVGLAAFKASSSERAGAGYAPLPAKCPDGPVHAALPIADSKTVRVRILHEMGVSYRFTGLCLTLDGARLLGPEFDKAAPAALARHEPVEWKGPMSTVGERSLGVSATLTGVGGPLDGHRFELVSSRVFAVRDGLTLTVKFYEQGGPQTPMEERPALRYMETTEPEPPATPPPP